MPNRLWFDQFGERNRVCLHPPAKKLSAYIIKLARLGGYLARAHDGPPGNTVIWRGISRITDIQLGFLLGARFVGN